jgi:GT2 family glycosyltransferase
MTDLSIVVLTWNGRELTVACLASIERELVRGAGGLAIETLLVDNGSNDGTVEAVRARFPFVQIVALPRNVGFAAGNNAGLARAQGRHVALLNNDTELLPGALEACVRYLDAHPDVGVVGPQLLHPDGRLQNSVHNAPTLLSEIVPRGVLETLAPHRFPSKRRPPRAPLDVEAVLGACMVARRAAVADVGPLPEDYFFFLEETDWLTRMRRAGWRVVHLPEARLVHVHGAATKRRLPLATRIEYHRSLYHFFGKHRGRGRTALLVVVRLLRLVLALVILAPIALFVPAQCERWRQRAAILAWHLRGCPASWGLAGARTAAEGPA